MLRFDLPEQVLPMQVDKALLKLNVNAPNMKVRVFTLKSGGKGPEGFSGFGRRYLTGRFGRWILRSAAGRRFSRMAAG